MKCLRAKASSRKSAKKSNARCIRSAVRKKEFERWSLNIPHARAGNLKRALKSQKKRLPALTDFASASRRKPRRRCPLKKYGRFRRFIKLPILDRTRLRYF